MEKFSVMRMAVSAIVAGLLGFAGATVASASTLF